MEKVEDFVAKLTLDLSVKGHKKMITKAA